MKKWGYSLSSIFKKPRAATKDKNILVLNFEGVLGEFIDAENQKEGISHIKMRKGAVLALK